MNKELIYLTYQTFPSETANTIQTIDNLKYFSKKKYSVKVLFPLRSENSTDNIEVLKKYYDFKENISFLGVPHNLPFGKYKFAEKYLFIISHYLWSKKICKNYNFENDDRVQFFTRSDWIFYFLSKKRLKVIFECHQLSKIRKWVLKKSIKSNNSKVIFLNEALLLDSGINKDKYEKNITIIPNGVDVEFFSKNKKKNMNQIIFTGNLKRFNENRNLNFVINTFLNKKMPEQYSFKVIGGPFNESEKLKSYISEVGLNNKVEILDRLSRESTIKHIEKAGIGLLINSSNNLHSVKYSSPLKYFEYLFGELKILAIDFPSHKTLPFSKNISFFNDGDEISFITALNNLNKIEAIKIKDLETITMESRANKIVDFISS